MKKIIVDVKSKTFKGITCKAYDKKGDVLPINAQVSLMKSDPSSFGYGVIDVGKELEFININSKYLLFSYHNWVKDVNKHLSDNEACEVLSNIKNNVILGADYIDTRDNIEMRSLFVGYQNRIYLAGLKNGVANNISIVSLSTLYDGGDDRDIIDFLKKIINNKKQIYLNKKSNELLTRFALKDSVINMIITNKIIK